MADFYCFFFFCKLQPQENNLSIQLIGVHAKRVSLISFRTALPQNLVSRVQSLLALGNDGLTGATESATVPAGLTAQVHHPEGG